MNKIFYPARAGWPVAGHGCAGRLTAAAFGSIGDQVSTETEPTQPPQRPESAPAPAPTQQAPATSSSPPRIRQLRIPVALQRPRIPVRLRRPRLRCPAARRRPASRARRCAADHHHQARRRGERGLHRHRQAREVRKGPEAERFSGDGRQPPGQRSARSAARPICRCGSGLLIDASNSVRDRFKFEQEAAIEFLNQIIRSNFDRAFVIGFDTTPEVTQDFTDNTEALPRAFTCCAPAAARRCTTPSTMRVATS